MNSSSSIFKLWELKSNQLISFSSAISIIVFMINVLLLNSYWFWPFKEFVRFSRAHNTSQNCTDRSVKVSYSILGQVAVLFVLNQNSIVSCL